MIDCVGVGRGAGMMCCEILFFLIFYSLDDCEECSAEGGESE